MQILFFFTAYWVGNYGGDFYDENIKEIHYSLRMQMSLGWMMCILAGVSFSILPLIYDVIGFEKTLMRIYVGMNVVGQIAISAGIISKNLSTFNSLTAVGMTLLCASLVSLWSPAMTIFRSKSGSINSVGPFSYALGAFLPVLGVITLLCWILRYEFSSLLQFSENLVIDFFFSLALVALIISHLNRRLDWEIIRSENIGKVFGIYAVLLILGLISGPLHERGDLSTSVKGVLQLLPYVFIFLAVNPRKIIQQIGQSKSYNPMLVCSVLWLPFVGISAYLETMGYFQVASEISPYYRWVLIFGVAFQVLWGFTEYLHQDHKKIAMKSRKTNLFAIISINAGNAVTIYAMFSSWINDEVLYQFPRLGVVTYALAYLSILIYWIKETFFCLYTWHKIPMFYDQYLANPEQGSGYTDEN
tara:strand:- start:9623 stop:10870 length:1248 start_codon:yes stop_codon:yes gene_type:complete